MTSGVAETPGTPDFLLSRIGFSNLPGWDADDPRALLRAMADCLAYLKDGKRYKTGQLGISVDDFFPALEAARTIGTPSASEARQFFEEHFEPFSIVKRDGKPGFVTGFYEPEVEVSDRPDQDYRFPFYRRPDDLVDITDENRPDELDHSYVYGRLLDGAISAYADRRDIDCGYLDGRGLEIAWAKSKADVFFTHVQGAARLLYRDGTMKRITYAAKAGHPFSAIGKLLVERGEISLDQISMQAIRAWLASHPQEADEVYWHNRSYIFFRESSLTDPDRGPIAAAKVPLVPGRSLAVDRSIHTFGLPFYIHAPELRHLDGGQSFARLMLALDTGTAIVGPARGDIFTGWGQEAGEMAGTIRNEAQFYIFIPRRALPRFT